MNLYMICAVANTDPEISYKYVEALEQQGHTVHWPFRDTPQEIDYIACAVNYTALVNCDAVVILWDSDSRGSIFDFGMTFALRKPYFLLEPVYKTNSKSFENVLCRYASGIGLESIPRCYFDI